MWPSAESDLREEGVCSPTLVCESNADSGPSLSDEKTEAWREAAEAEEDKDVASERDRDRLPQALGGCSTVHGWWTRDGACRAPTAQGRWFG